MWKLEKFPFDSELEKYEGEVIVTGYNIKTVVTSSKYQILSSKKFLKSGQKPITGILHLIITFGHRPYGVIHF